MYICSKRGKVVPAGLDICSCGYSVDAQKTKEDGMVCEKCGNEVTEGETCECYNKPIEQVPDTGYYDYRKKMNTSKYYCSNCGGELRKRFDACSICGYDEFKVKKEEPSMILCYLTGIIYPAIIAILAIALFSAGVTTLYGLIISIILSACSSVSIILSGLYLLVVPLPIITFFKWGNCKPNQATRKKVLYTIFAIITPILAVVALFIHELI